MLKTLLQPQIVQIANGKAISYSSISPEQCTFPLKQSSEISKLGINLYSSLQVLLLKTHQKIIQLPIHNYLSFQFKKNADLNSLEEVRVAQIKQMLIAVIKNHIQKQVLRLKNQLSNTKMNQEIIIESEQMFSYLFGQFQKQLDNVLKQCIYGLQIKYADKQLYKIINIKWNTNFVQSILKDTIKYLSVTQTVNAGKYKNQDKHADLRKRIQQKKYKIGTKSSLLNQQLDIHVMDELKNIMAKLNCTLVTKNQLINLFAKCDKAVKQKQKQLQKWIKTSQQMGAVLEQQMTVIFQQMISEQAQQQEMIFIKNQLSLVEERCQMFQNEIIALQRDIANLTINNSTLSNEGYYINPEWEKNQIEEKLLIQIIQRDSDLLMAKNQVNSLTESILQMIKMTHSAFEDLFASKGYVNSYNRSIGKLLKDMKSFDNIDLDLILSLKQDLNSLSNSDSQLRKSGMSTLCELDMSCLKISRSQQSLQEDSLYNFSNDQ